MSYNLLLGEKAHNLSESLELANIYQVKNCRVFFLSGVISQILPVFLL